MNWFEKNNFVGVLRVSQGHQVCAAFSTKTWIERNEHVAIVPLEDFQAYLKLSRWGTGIPKEIVLETVSAIGEEPTLYFMRKKHWTKLGRPQEIKGTFRFVDSRPYKDRSKLVDRFAKMHIEYVRPTQLEMKYAEEKTDISHD